MSFPVSDGPNPVFREMLAQLSKAAENIPKAQAKMQALTGVAWSDDRLVKAVVGSRGQLVDLEIDPRVFRNPDAGELSAKIVHTANAAARDVSAQAREVLEEGLPPDMAELRAQYAPDRDELPDMFRTDAELYAEQKEDR
ncbi:YbaB/EbfC family nucleoid-associated protein [Amycolatopsis acidicola]|uniref:YbaB/EbfC family nucleoid-associated protein n=1 Tax=Amycolatopsis acidicola TaxID=2596893 RepID=A0A5N0V105_9PSEU|nr:YbaB/EbfC family nucleoid-associated protein [Amycolatopsis acidicola]KAA9160149.1 YbaB/EbfC family nucleoid-associated protein [Amycolatopsis acidicola]